MSFTKYVYGDNDNHSVHVDGLGATPSPEVVLTAEDVAAINAARDALSRIAEKCAREGWDALKNGYEAVIRQNAASPQSFGRLAGTCVLADDALFSVLNVAHAHLDLLLTQEQLHNSEAAA